MRRFSPTTIRRGAERLDRHPLALGLAVLAVAAFVSYLSVIAINGVPFEDRFKLQAVVPADSPQLKDGDEVRIGGQRVGQVRAVERHDDGTLLKMELTKGTIGRDARAAVRLRGLAGATYVDIDPGDASRPLPAGATLPRDRATAGVELQDVVDVFDAEVRRSLGRTLETYGGGLLGRGGDLNAAIEELPPTLAQTTPLVRAFAPGEGELSGFLREVRATARGFAPRGSRELEALMPLARQTFDGLAARRGELGATIDLLHPLESEVLRTAPVADALLDDLRAAVEPLNPGIRALGKTAPDLAALFARDRELAQLSRLSRRAIPVLKDAEPLVVELRPAAASLGPLARPLEPLAGHLARYRREILLAPLGFTRWGKFVYPTGNPGNHRAVRFAPVFTCHQARDPYPDPGEAQDQEKRCRS